MGKYVDLVRAPLYPLLLTRLPGDELLLVSCGQEGLSRWDAWTGERIWVQGEGQQADYGNDFAAVPLRGGGVLFAAATEDGIDRWDGATGQEYQADSAIRTSLEIWCLDAGLLPDGRSVLVAGGSSGEVYRWNAISGEPLGSPTGCSHGTVLGIAFAATADGSAVVVSGHEDGEIQRWDALRGTAIGGVLPTPQDWGAVRNIATAVLPTGRHLVVGQDTDGTVLRWDLLTGELVGGAIRPPAESGTLTTLQDGCRTLILGSFQDLVIRQWDAATGELIDDSLTGYSVAAAALASGDPVIATGSELGFLTVHGPASTPSRTWPACVRFYEDTYEAKKARWLPCPACGARVFSARPGDGGSRSRCCHVCLQFVTLPNGGDW